MAYVAPGVEVTEEILNGGGTNSINPALPTVILGPAYNVIIYTPGSAAANVQAFSGAFSAASSGIGVTTDFNMPSPYAGQVVDLTSIEVYTSSALVETFSASGTVPAGTTNVIQQLSGQPAFNSTLNGIAEIQPGYQVQITYSDGTTQSTHVYTAPTASTLTVTDTLSSSGTVNIDVFYTFNDVLISPSNYSTSNVGTNGYISFDGNVQTTYGTLASGDIYIQYNALRQDITNQMLTYQAIGDVTGTLGTIHSTNRLALGLQCALAGSGAAPVYGVAVSSDDEVGYLAAAEAIENMFVYCMVPLTQQIAVLTTLQANADDMSQPKYSQFRVVCCNTAQPTSVDVGPYSATYENTGATIAANTGGSGYILTATNATFISDGVLPSDQVVTGGGTYTVQTVVSNQQLIISGPTSAATGVSYYITRNLTAQQMAQAVADTSSTFMDSRVWHVQPDIVGVPVGTKTEYLPGYYLAAAYAGLSAGEPVQQSFTNLTIPGIVDLKHSNFFYTRTQLDLMAGAGTCLTVQDTPGGIPYCRHSLTTNMANVTSQEIMLTRDVDSVAYYFKALLKPYIGKWNVVADTIHIMQQTVQSGIQALIAAKQPQIGAPLRSGSQLVSLTQNPNAADSTVCVIKAVTPYPNNYTYITVEV